ncbi:MAG: hypothetical protein QOD66_3820 [Solirubrobacteraceae bacterium]|nr:hypothetical protein [Solirubrobacteraceae bacterium]
MQRRQQHAPAEREQHLAEHRAECRPGAAGKQARQHERERPQRAASRSEHDERKQRQPPRSSRQRDEGPRERQQSREEDRPDPAFIDHALPPPEHRTGARHARHQSGRSDAVGDQRADHVSARRRQHRGPEAHPVRADGKARKQKRDLARDRDAGALGDHQQEHAEHAEMPDHRGQGLPRFGRGGGGGGRRSRGGRVPE